MRPRTTDLLVWAEVSVPVAAAAENDPILALRRLGGLPLPPETENHSRCLSAKSHNCKMHGRGDILPLFERVTHVVVALGSAAGSFCSFCTGQFGVFVSVDIRCCNDGMLAGRLTECRITFSIAPPGRVWTGDLVAATLLAMVCPPLLITCGRLSDVCCGKLGKCAFLRRDPVRLLTGHVPCVGQGPSPKLGKSSSVNWTGAPFSANPLGSGGTAAPSSSRRDGAYSFEGIADLCVSMRR